MKSKPLLTSVALLSCLTTLSALAATNTWTGQSDGVALAAIQGLNQKLKQKETELAELKTRLERLERLFTEQGDAAK